MKILDASTKDQRRIGINAAFLIVVEIMNQKKSKYIRVSDKIYSFPAISPSYSKTIYKNVLTENFSIIMEKIHTIKHKYAVADSAQFCIDYSQQ